MFENIWRPEDNGPFVHMINWTIFKYKDETYHLVGSVAGEGRVCSPIQSYKQDKDTYVFTTRSGKHYKVNVDSKQTAYSLSSNANYTLGAWFRFNGGSEFAKFLDNKDAFDLFLKELDLNVQV